MHVLVLLIQSHYHANMITIKLHFHRLEDSQVIIIRPYPISHLRRNLVCGINLLFRQNYMNILLKIAQVVYNATYNFICYENTEKK